MLFSLFPCTLICWAMFKTCCTFLLLISMKPIIHKVIHGLILILSNILICSWKRL